MSTLRVYLADAPTDILVWLVSHTEDHWWTLNGIADAVAPDDADDALRSTAGALRLLYDCGFIEGREFDGMPMWRATGEGRAAVGAATHPAQLHPGSPQ